MINRTRLGELFQGATTLLMLTTYTVLCGIPMFAVAMLKLIPVPAWQLLMTRMAGDIAAFWTRLNNAWLDRTHPVRWEIDGLETVYSGERYLLVANHQSWLDIAVLQYTFNRKIPVLKFFIKDVLKWMPILGMAWWTMGCPFMKRYSKAYLEKYPHKKGNDFKATLKAVRAFRKTPGTITSFVEGTRFTPAKRSSQKAPYAHLLKPRAGGVSLVIQAMEGHLDHMLDVSIAYPEGPCSLWDFLCHRVRNIRIHIRKIAIPVTFSTAADLPDPACQEAFREWLNGIWTEKDAILANLLGSSPDTMPQTA